jgi:23S rRNA-/tRNA-specific pseudouridylate synthase
VKYPSVVGFLYHHFKEMPSYGTFIRAGLIHRLDKETDGIMIIAKTEKGLQHFKQLFQAKSEAQSIEEKEAVPLQKFYRAMCELTPEGECFLQEVEKS